MGFGVVLLFAAILIGVLAIRGTYQHLPPFADTTKEEPGAPRIQANIRTAQNLANTLVNS